MSFRGNYTVINEECPSEPEERTIYIHESDGRELLSSVIRD